MYTLGMVYTISEPWTLTERPFGGAIALFSIDYSGNFPLTHLAGIPMPSIKGFCWLYAELYWFDGIPWTQYRTENGIYCI
jgi:hypothetical protein